MPVKTIALLTGRGNNSLRDKNLIPILGKPVLYYPAHAAKSSSIIDDWYCSSDDKHILLEAKKEGYKPIQRPDDISRPDSLHVDCIYHALDVLNVEGATPDILVVILANNVSICSRWISDCVQIMEENMEITAVVPVYQDNDHHPLRAKKINDDRYLEGFLQPTENFISSNRQSLTPCYFLCHNFWVLNVAWLKKRESGPPPWGFMGPRTIPYIVDSSIDIHVADDLAQAEIWIKKNYID